MHWMSVGFGFSFYFDYTDYSIVTWMRFDDFIHRPTVRMSSFSQIIPVSPTDKLGHRTCYFVVCCKKIVFRPTSPEMNVQNLTQLPSLQTSISCTMACHGVWDLYIRGCKCTSEGVARGSTLTPEDVQITYIIGKPWYS